MKVSSSCQTAPEQDKVTPFFAIIRNIMPVELGLDSQIMVVMAAVNQCQSAVVRDCVVS